MSWKDWLADQRKKSEMTVEEISLSEVDDPWGMHDGNYCREPEGFFNIVGAKIRANREVSDWSQPIMKELGKGVVVLVKSMDKHRRTMLLLIARQEPGNPANKNHILLGPTIQASESNMAQVHGGKRPPFAELLDKYGDSIIWIELPQDGGRFFGKVNKYAIMEIATEGTKEIVLSSNASWFYPTEISEALVNGDVNEHLSQALALERML
jgi:oxidase EvaA